MKRLAKILGAVILTAVVLVSLAPTAALAASPTAAELSTILQTKADGINAARTLVLQAQISRSAADTAKGVYDAAQTAASNALTTAQNADKTARAALSPLVLVATSVASVATWQPIAQLLPGNSLVQQALTSAQQYEGLQAIAGQRLTDWTTATTAATSALTTAQSAVSALDADSPLKAQIEQLTKDNELLKKQAADATKERDSEKARADKVSGERDKAVADLSVATANASSLREDKEKMKGEIIAAAMARDSAIAEAKEARQQRDAADAAKAAAEQRVIALAGERDAAVAKAAAADQRAAAAESALADARRQIDDLRARLAATLTPAATVPAAPAAAAPAAQPAAGVGEKKLDATAADPILAELKSISKKIDDASKENAERFQKLEARVTELEKPKSPPPAGITQEQLNAAIAAATTTLRGEISALRDTVTANTQTMGVSNTLIILVMAGLWIALILAAAIYWLLARRRKQPEEEASQRDRRDRKPAEQQATGAQAASVTGAPAKT